MKSFEGKDWSKGFALWIWFPLATLCFVIGVLFSIHFFPSAFDWRYETLSNLSTASTNPHGYSFSCLGLMAAFGMGMPLCGYIRVRFEPVAPRAAWFGYRAIRVGFFGSVVVGLERLFAPQISWHIHKAHEYVSIVTFVGLLLGIAGYWVCLTAFLLRERRWPVWALVMLSLVSVGPILGTGLSQGYLYLVPNDLGWVGPEWAALGVPLYLSFAFWEWLTCAGIFVYLFLILLCLPAEILAHPREEEKFTPPRSSEPNQFVDGSA